MIKGKPNIGWITRTVIAAGVFVAAWGPARTTTGETVTPVADPIRMIEQDYQSGAISLDQKALLVITAIKHSDSLPSKYRISEPSRQKIDLRSPTMAIKGIILDWEHLAPATKAAVSSMLGRQTTAYEYDSPGGEFKLHYDVTGLKAVPATDDDLDGIPDFVEKCAAYCDTSSQKHLELGYRIPPSDDTTGGDNRYDIYFDNFDYYGMTVPELPGPEPWNDYTSYIVLNSTFQGFPPNDDPEGQWQGSAKATAAHEFHHAVQFAYDINEGDWFMELDATYMEDIVFDQVNDNHNYMSSFFSYPEISLMDNSYHAYSCFVWGMYLAERFDTSLMVAIWDGARYQTISNALSDTLIERYGVSQDSAFADFTTWNLVTGSRNDGLHYSEGAGYNEVAIGRTHNYFPVSLTNSPKSPAGYGSCYVQFIPAGFTGKWRFIFDGADSRQWGAYLIKSTAPNVHQFAKIPLDPVTFAGEMVVDSIQNYYRITLVGANLTEFSSGANFSYEVDRVTPYAVESEVLTDSAVYSGGTRRFRYHVTNTSAVNDIFDVIFRDEKSWVTPDTISRPILAGMDTVLEVAVSPPAGTPLGTTSMLYFKAQSWGDPQVVDSVARVAETVLQRGDANFSGKINVADVAYLNEFLFGHGTQPKPTLLAGDANCNSAVTVSDVTKLLTYLFAGGSLPSCNPY